MARGMTANDLFRIRWVSDPQIAPDGRQVAFVVTTLDAKADEYRSTIWIAPARGRGRPRPHTTGPKRDTSPRWSPDGRRLAFLSDRGNDKPQLHVMDASGGEAVRLTDLPGGASDPVWSPDGRRVVLVSQDPEDRSEAGRKRPRVIRDLKYKMNAEGLVQDRHRHLYLVDVENGLRQAQATPGQARLPEVRQLTRGDWDDVAPAWSPDGRRIAFVSARHPERDYDAAYDLFVLDIPAAGARWTQPAEPRQLTHTVGAVALPAWSPDGQSLAYLGHTDRMAALARNYRLWVIPAAGGEPRCLTADLDRHLLIGGGADRVAPPTWAADGSRILVGVMDWGNVQVRAVSLDGGLTEVLSGDRTISHFSAARDGTLAYVTSDPTHPAEVYVARPDGSGERQITNLNGRWLAGVSLSPAEPLLFRSADGTQVQGWVLKPVGFREGERYPLLVNIHGGPHAQYGNVFFDEVQAQAGAGYGVFYANPRGSQGYGEGFADAIRGAWGTLDYDDVLAGTDAVSQLRWVDPDRMGVLGGSYGGYMTSWVVGHTDRFRAACSERAVNNVHSIMGTSDIGGWFVIREMGGSLAFDDPKHYLDRSPISYVRNIRTPLLIIHSEDDLRCPIEQAEQLFVALKLLRQEVEFIRFPGENHELSRSGKPSHRTARFGYLLRFFDKWLQGQE